MCVSESEHDFWRKSSCTCNFCISLCRHGLPPVDERHIPKCTHTVFCSQKVTPRQHSFTIWNQMQLLKYVSWNPNPGASSWNVNTFGSCPQSKRPSLSKQEVDATNLCLHVCCSTVAIRVLNVKPPVALWGFLVEEISEVREPAANVTCYNPNFHRYSWKSNANLNWCNSYNLGSTSNTGALVVATAMRF